MNDYRDLNFEDDYHDSDKYDNYGLVSVCCGAPKTENSNICTYCGNPTSFEQDIEDQQPLG